MFNWIIRIRFWLMVSKRLYRLTKKVRSVGKDFNDKSCSMEIDGSVRIDGRTVRCMPFWIHPHTYRPGTLMLTYKHIDDLETAVYLWAEKELGNYNTIAIMKAALSNEDASEANQLLRAVK